MRTRWKQIKKQKTLQCVLCTANNEIRDSVYVFFFVVVPMEVFRESQIFKGSPLKCSMKDGKINIRELTKGA